MKIRDLDVWERWASDAAVAETRANTLAALAAELARWTGRRFARQDAPPIDVRALEVTVAQYWADNADDEVHLMPHVCAHESPIGIHACADADGGCDICAASDWDHEIGVANIPLVPAFEAFCHERGDQNRDDTYNARPWAVARASGVEVIGALVRPWLDMPAQPTATLPADQRLVDLVAACRHDPHALAVLADELEHRGLPRELPPRTWLGALEPHVPRSALSIANGVPDEIGLWLDGTSVQLDDPLPLAAAPRVRFLPTSEQVMGPALARARALGPLHEAALADIATGGATFLCEELEVDVRDYDFDPAALRAAIACMPRLRKIIAIGNAVAKVAPVLHELSIERVVAPRVHAEDKHVAALKAWRGISVAMFDDDAIRATGWLVRPDGAIDHAGYHAHADPARLAALRAAVAR